MDYIEFGDPKAIFKAPKFMKMFPKEVSQVPTFKSNNKFYHVREIDDGWKPGDNGTTEDDILRNIKRWFYGENISIQGKTIKP